MKTTARLAGAAGLALAASALLAAPASAAPAHQPAGHTAHRAGAAVFVQTDNVNGNSVAVYNQAADGTLRAAGSTPTGGRGGMLTGSVVDHLASQGSLAYNRGSVFAVNAGSNTITTFSVHGDRLTRRQVTSTGGSFPVSIAVRGNLAYVLNARDGGSIQGYLRFGSVLVRVPAWHRALGLDPTATPEFTNTPGQVAFTPDGSKLVVTTKANGNDIDVFAVHPFGGVSARPVVNVDAGQVPFGVTFDPRGHLVVAEAGTNSVASFAFGRQGTLSLISRVATGQAATCWIVPIGTKLYASNAGSGNLSGYQDTGSGQLAALGTTATDGGTVDAAASSNGHYLYVQTGAAGIVDEFRVAANGALTRIGSVVVPNAVGGEGIATG